MSWKKALLLKEEQGKRNRKEREEWETIQNDAEIREQKKNKQKLGESKKAKGNSSAAAVIRVESS